jgi:hypothetical protein
MSQPCTPNLPPTLEEAVRLFNDMYINAHKFYTKGTVAAAARNRKAWSNIIKIAKRARNEIQRDKKAAIARKKLAKTQ